MKTLLKSLRQISFYLCICLICASCTSSPSLSEKMDNNTTSSDTSSTSDTKPAVTDEQTPTSTTDQEQTSTSTATNDTSEAKPIDTSSEDTSKQEDSTNVVDTPQTPPSLDTYNFDPTVVYEVQDAASLSVLVNKLNALPATYSPDDLVKPNIPFSTDAEDEKHTVRTEMGSALELLFQAGTDAGVNLVGVSGYRSYARQKVIYSNKVAAVGQEAADKVSAQPGKSEHQTGLAIDVSCEAVGYNLSSDFGETPEGLWLAEHAYEYGFIIRYQKDKTDITGYNYEPWHIRYVGKEIADELQTSGETLDQYYEHIATQN